MYALDKSRRTKTRLETNPYGLSDYEHLEVLAPTEEKAGHRPVKSKRNSLNGGKVRDTGAVSGARILKTRKRRDGKVKTNHLEAKGTLLTFSCPPKTGFPCCRICGHGGSDGRVERNPSTAIEPP